MKIIFIILLILIVDNSVFSQQEKFSDLQREKIIISQLSPDGKNLSKKLMQDTKKADNYMSTADRYYEELVKYRLELENTKDKKKQKKLLKKAVKVENKALKSRVESLDNYHEVAVRKYQIYKNDLKKFMKTASKQKVDSAQKLEQGAYSSFEEAEIKVQIAYNTVNYGDLFDIYTQAYKLEQIGLLYQTKMYALFLGWSINELNTIDNEIIAIQENRPVNIESFENNNTFSDSVIYKEVLVYDTVLVNNKKNIPVYKVQIAASKKPLSIIQLRKFYPSDDIINTVIDGDWYKYSVGNFESYHEAKKFKINIGVRDAFIVAYLNGKRIAVSSAMKISGNK